MWSGLFVTILLASASSPCDTEYEDELESCVFRFDDPKDSEKLVQCIRQVKKEWEQCRK